MAEDDPLANAVNAASKFQGADSGYHDYSSQEVDQGHRKLQEDWKAYKPFLEMATETDSKKKAGKGLKIAGEAAAKSLGWDK